MPCLIKERTATSPGIITFTHGEALSPLLRARRVRAFLEHAEREGRWLFGVHVQGDCSWIERWPLRDWQSFFLWPEADAPWLANVPQPRQIAMNCINLMPVPPAPPAGMARTIDLCIISRASTIKRIRETLLTLRALMNLRPGLTATIVVPDNRHLAEGDATYRKQHIDRDFFELPLKLFNARELKQLSFLSSANDAFGRFPVSDSLMTDILYRSKFMFLPSHSEGTPRVIAESFLTNAPVILSEKLRSGIRRDFSERDTLFVDDDPAIAAGQINLALQDYDRFRVDVPKFQALYGRDANLPRFQDALAAQIRARGRSVEGAWFLEDLHLRLACHGQVQNFGFFFSEKLFFDFMAKLDMPGGMTADPYDEAAFYGDLSADRPSIAQRADMYLRNKAPRSLIQIAKKVAG